MTIQTLNDYTDIKYYTDTKYDTLFREYTFKLILYRHLNTI